MLLYFNATHYNARPQPAARQLETISQGIFSMLEFFVLLIVLAPVAWLVWSDPSGSLTRYNKLINAHLTGKLPSGPDPNPVMGPPAPRKPMPIFWKIALFGFIGLMLFGFLRDVLG
jgi:hypothetical protein